MDIKRLGSMHPTTLSFMRALVRRMVRENWQIDTSNIKLDDQGLGSAVYKINANGNSYSFVLFSHYLPDQERNDRVIAERWDVTMTLCRGELSKSDIQRMRENVPKQEAGRATPQQIVLSRGNRSARNFQYVVDKLASGEQPELDALAKVGYLYRTTAVYGGGKFGMADWELVRKSCPEFSKPFAAEMFNCYLLRDFSIRQAEHLAKVKSPKTAVSMQACIQRFLGIGNSTGLGMAPYLIRHPQLISRWVLVREQAIAQVVQLGCCDGKNTRRLQKILQQAILHLQQTFVPDELQTQRNAAMRAELAELVQVLDKHDKKGNWSWLTDLVYAQMSLETQEIIHSALLELHSNLVDESLDFDALDERANTDPAMPIAKLITTIERHYDWALAIDFSKNEENHYFWYVSEEKQEPRIGERFSEPGANKEQPLIIAKRVRNLYDALCRKTSSQSDTVAVWLLSNPQYSGIVSRVQTMSQECYGEIRGNLANQEMLPLDLLRCKLSFFGVSKFDPKSKLWVRNTMFQGAPVLSDLANQQAEKYFSDDWYFPIAQGA